MNPLKNRLVLGIDFGSTAVRVLTMAVESGETICTVEQAYEMGVEGVFTSAKKTLIARQSPEDYITSLQKVLKKAQEKNESLGFQMNQVVGIGVDTTGSTPLPITKNMMPLSSLPEFKGNLNAMAWMWKDHSAHKEAKEITDAIKEIRPHYLKKIGGAYSSEWFWAKIAHCHHVDKKVFQNAYTWLELSDFIPAILSGVKEAHLIKRNSCAAGHKALYNDEWNGFPDTDFITSLDPNLISVSKTLPPKTLSIEHICGHLCEKWSKGFGLSKGIPISMGILDAHAGAIGSGIKEGSLVKIIGTSTCDLVLGKLSGEHANIKGVASTAQESVLPKYYGIEAGQSAVGDLLNWYIKEVLNHHKNHQQLSLEASKLQAGESGLISLDWNNGNRSTLSDPLLSGLLIGQTLQTKDFEIYRALIEATAFGARRIIEAMESQGVVINEVVNCGGISHKNQLFMQIYADVINKPMKIAAGDETVALGAAIMGAKAAYIEAGTEITYNELQNKSCKMLEKVYLPQNKSVKTYDKLYKIYLNLHDSFGKKDHPNNLYNVMKDLIIIKTNNHE
ncbi:MAG: ribulokinase [Bacteroidales bacterium]|nr:ribulokinase [Bacteroidales bacterium]